MRGLHCELVPKPWVMKFMTLQREIMHKISAKSRI